MSFLTLPFALFSFPQNKVRVVYLGRNYIQLSLGQSRPVLNTSFFREYKLTSLTQATYPTPTLRGQGYLSTIKTEVTPWSLYSSNFTSNSLMKSQLAKLSVSARSSLQTSMSFSSAKQTSVFPGFFSGSTSISSSARNTTNFILNKTQSLSYSLKFEYSQSPSSQVTTNNSSSTTLLSSLRTSNMNSSSVYSSQPYASS